MTGTKADFALLKKGAYDRLVFACRAEAYRTPGIPGWGEMPCVTADSFSRETAKGWKNKRVAVLGGDAFACELAWLLQSESLVKKAVVITDGADIMAGESESDRAWMKHHLPLRGGAIVCGARPVRMRKRVLVLEDTVSGKERHVVCDRLLLAARSPAPLRLYNEAVREKLAPNIQLL